MMRFHRLNTRGDTLVEVLIAIAVASLILGGAYATTNRSLKSTRDAEERGNALKLVESQIEQLKGIAAADPDEIFGAGVPASYCIASGAIVAASDPDCAVDSGGNATSTEPVYHLRITRSANTFTVRNTWNSVQGVQNSAEMKYRVYE